MTLNLFADVSIFLIAWVIVYVASQDIMKLIAKHFCFMTAIVALAEGWALYGDKTIFALFSIALSVWLLTLFFDFHSRFHTTAS